MAGQAATLAGGGRLLGFPTSIFRGCKKFEICYNSDVNHYKNSGDYMNRFAFTLAEVLITLGIIGVVAALTMPNLIANHKAKQLRTAFLKGYSMLTQAYEQYHKDTSCSTTDCLRSGFYMDLKPYFKIAKYCKIDNNLNDKDCFKRETTDTSYKNFSKTVSGISTYMFDDGQFVTIDGMLVTFEQQATGNKYVFIGLDTNGHQKGPNVLGQDLFLFQIVNKGDRGFVLPVGAEGTAYKGDTYCSLTSTNSVNGYTCAAKALAEQDFFKKLK